MDLKRFSLQKGGAYTHRYYIQYLWYIRVSTVRMANGIQCYVENLPSKEALTAKQGAAKPRT